MAGKFKYHLITFGCQMNKSDSERLAALLDRVGLTETSREDRADVIIINSCSVRQSAEDRIFGKLKKYAEWREKRPNLIVAVTGCLPGRDRDGKIRAKMPEADLYFPTKDMVNLPRWLAELNPELANSGDCEADYLKIRPRFAPGVQAFVSIQTGCNKFCSYCVVPYARGLERNRPAVDILTEVRDLAGRGYLEITLLGQAVNAYQAPDRAAAFSKVNPYVNDFAALLWEINQVPGIARIHYTAAHPLHMSAEVIDALTLPKHVNYLHLPVQAGNDEVLKRMNRKYTRERYLEIIRQVRAKKPDIALGTDIIVGFCGETPAQFADTVSLYRECDFDIAYIARYSPRSGTLSAKLFEDDVPREEKKRRWLELDRLMRETTLRKNQRFVGQVVEVLVDEKGDGWCGGNSRELKRVRFETSEDWRQKLVRVKIEKALEWLLMGQLDKVL